VPPLSRVVAGGQARQKGLSGTQLPALDQLDEQQLEQVWRLAGGHPRLLEYADALRAAGGARYPDVTARITATIGGCLDGTGHARWRAARTSLDAASGAWKRSVAARPPWPSAGT